jgi:hypothetical protein
VLFHLEHLKYDAWFDRVWGGARPAAMRSAPALVVDAAMEGLTFSL